MSIYIDLKTAILSNANDPDGDDMEILDLIKDLSNLLQSRILARSRE